LDDSARRALGEGGGGILGGERFFRRLCKGHRMYL
jgi:hypothetical protein